MRWVVIPHRSEPLTAIRSVVTQSAEELPLKRVYLRMPDREVPILKIASWRRDVDQTLVTYKMYGPYREDGFYLFPLGAYLRIAQLQVDLAAHRIALPVLELPSQGVPQTHRSSGRSSGHLQVSA
jgi:hypothetical protein